MLKVRQAPRTRTTHYPQAVAAIVFSGCFFCHSSKPSGSELRHTATAAATSEMGECNEERQKPGAIEEHFRRRFEEYHMTGRDVASGASYSFGGGSTGMAACTTLLGRRPDVDRRLPGASVTSSLCRMLRSNAIHEVMCRRYFRNFSMESAPPPELPCARTKKQHDGSSFSF